MSKYTIGDMVYSHCGFQRSLCKYEVVNVRKPTMNELDDVVDFRYEWNNRDKAHSDPYLYELKFSKNQSDIDNISQEEIRMFSHKVDQLTTQIHGKSHT